MSAAAASLLHQAHLRTAFEPVMSHPKGKPHPKAASQVHLKLLYIGPAQQSCLFFFFSFLSCLRPHLLTTSTRLRSIRILTVCKATARKAVQPSSSCTAMHETVEMLFCPWSCVSSIAGLSSAAMFHTGTPIKLELYWCGSVECSHSCLSCHAVYTRPCTKALTIGLHLPF